MPVGTRRLARLLGAPLLTTLLANGLFAGDRRRGVRAAGGRPGLQLIKDVDVLVSAGASLSQGSTHFGSAIEGKTIIRIDSDPDVLAMPPGTGHIALRGDVRATARALIEAITPMRTAPACRPAELRGQSPGHGAGPIAVSRHRHRPRSAARAR